MLCGITATRQSCVVLRCDITVLRRLQAPVYDILPSTTAIFSYAIRSRKLSANKQFFVGAQTIQKKKRKEKVSFIAANKVYTSTNKTTLVWIETELFFFFFFFFSSSFLLLLLFFFFFFYPGGCVSCLRACFGARLLLQYPNLSEGADPSLAPSVG